MPKLTIMKGLPASGKSTRAKELVEKSQGKTKRINRDDLRAMLDNGQWSKGNEAYVKSMQRAMAEAAIKSGYNVIIDDTNLVQATYDGWVEFGMQQGCDVETEDFTHVPVNLCIERDKQRLNSVGEEVIRRMNKLIPRDKKVVPIRRVWDPSLPTAVICDIDGTIAHMGDKRGPFDWKKVGVDHPDEEVRRVLRRLIAHEENPPTLFYLSGRDGSCREETLGWLEAHDFPVDPKTSGYRLVMRPESDHRSDAIVKREFFDAHIADKYNVLCVLDDRDRVVDMWREELGLLVLQVARGAF